MDRGFTSILRLAVLFAIAGMLGAVAYLLRSDIGLAICQTRLRGTLSARYTAYFPPVFGKEHGTCDAGGAMGAEKLFQGWITLSDEGATFTPDNRSDDRSLPRIDSDEYPIAWDRHSGWDQITGWDYLPHEKRFWFYYVRFTGSIYTLHFDDVPPEVATHRSIAVDRFLIVEAKELSEAKDSRGYPKPVPVKVPFPGKPASVSIHN